MRTAVRVAIFLGLILSVSRCPIWAQSGIAQITGTILDEQRRPVAGAQVRLSGLVSKAAVTTADGSFVFLNLPAGVYRLDIAKAGFNSATQEDITAAAGSTTQLSFTLLPASLTSLTVIGHVNVSTRNAANQINTSPAAIVDVPATTFVQQGQLSVNRVLNEEPGLTVGVIGYTFSPGQTPTNGASPLAAGIPSVRGGLPYETESLIDGHPISLGQSGTFSPSFISPYLLQNVELVKGPGATSPSINYAINGTINYRTLEPTLKPQTSVDLGEDQYGGNFANFRTTGTLSGNHLSYAFDYVTQGTQGFQRGFDSPVWIYTGGATYLNGSPINPFGGFASGAPPASQANFYGSFSTKDSFIVCCPNIPMYSNQRNELGKIRYAFTPSTALTVTWLGGQTNGAYIGGYPGTCYDFTFTPPVNYTGTFPAGLTQVYPAGFGTGWNDIEITNLFETEFHMPLGNTATLQLRQYSSSIQTFNGGPGNSGPAAAGLTSITGGIYGGVYYGSSTTPTVFNGQPGTLTVNQYSEGRTYNDLSGYTAEIDKQAGNDLLSLAFDEERTSTIATQEGFCISLGSVIPAGSSQTFKSVMGRIQFELGQRLNGTVSDNFGSYTDIYTQNGGTTFQSTTHTYQAPRLSLTWQPHSGESFRASVGTSIAPPYIALLNNDEIITRAPGVPPPYYTENGNSGDVLPETAFGFDIGFDMRLHDRFTVVSLDAYQTILHDQFLQSTSQQGTYTCLVPGSFYGDTAPLYVTKTANLGHSEYEGIELSLRHLPPTGWGYRIQGSLMRAFSYDLPAGFYNTAAGPYTANLGVLPNINFQANGIAFNAMSSTRLPYAMGYGELNYRGHNGASFLLGVLYYGSNNSYNEPAFEVATVSYTQPVTHRSSLQLSIYNFTEAYPGIHATWNATPIHTPLANGLLGITSANVVGPEVARLTYHLEL